MELMTPEEANVWLERFISDGEWPEQLPNSQNSVPQEKKQLLSWSEFHSLMGRYCEYRGWQILSDGPGDFSLAIFATREDPATDRTEALQERLPFEEEDALPF
jgi:hypothetical protein